MLYLALMQYQLQFPQALPHPGYKSVYAVYKEIFSSNENGDGQAFDNGRALSAIAFLSFSCKILEDPKLLDIDLEAISINDLQTMALSSMTNLCTLSNTIWTLS